MVYLDDGDYRGPQNRTAKARPSNAPEGGVWTLRAHQVTWELGFNREWAAFEQLTREGEFNEQPESLRNVMRGPSLKKEGTARLGGDPSKPRR